MRGNRPGLSSRTLTLVSWALLTGATWSLLGTAFACLALGALLWVDVYGDAWLRRRS